MKIIEYEEKYADDVANLLVLLQEYIAGIDKEKFNIITKEFKENKFNKVIYMLKKYNGIMYLLEDRKKIIGLICGYICNDEDTYDFKVYKRGFINEFIIKEEYRKMGYGKMLLTKIETYFKECGCQGILLDCFAYNDNAFDFYIKNGFFNRVYEMMKKI